MSVVNIPTAAVGFHASIVGQAASAQRTVNRMQMSPKLNPKGFVQPLGRITNAASEFQKSMDASAARVFAFGAAVGIINGVSNAFSAMVKSAAEVEKSLKDIQVVMEATNMQMMKFGRGLFDVARNTATSFETVSESAVELARQGLGAKETLDRVNSALILARLSGLSAVKSTETLTAAINSFNKEGITHEQIVNRMANVDAAFAVSSKDLAEAISRAGAVAQSSGVSFNELASIVTAVQQRTARGGSVIGNGFKSIFTRIKRSGVREALEEIGVATSDSLGNFRSGISILKDYAKVYKTLSDAQKAYTSEQIAGVFQIQNLQALIQDLGDGYSIYDKALQTANGTTNEAIKRNEELNKTLSAIFTQTSLSAKELAARLGELAVSDSFKDILKLVGKLAEWLNKALDEDTGSDFAKNIVKGFGKFLAGPGFAIITAAFVKIFVLVAKFAREAFSDLLGMNAESKRQKGLQASIGSILASNSGIYQKIMAASGNTAKQQKIILKLIKQETAERLKQEALVKRISAGAALRGIGASESGFVPAGSLLSKRKGRKTLGMASGFLPSINREQAAIRNNVGGARRGDRPVVLRNHAMGKGRRQNVVAHTGEWKVPNFRGSGGTAIFNRSMIKKYGMPRGAKRITASDGFVPNFSRGMTRRPEKARASELGWKAGGSSPISKFSDSMDTFIGMLNVARISKGAKEIGNKAHSIIAGKRSSVNNTEIPFGNNSIFDKQIGTGENAGKEKYVINPKFKNISGVKNKFLKNGIHSGLLKDGNGKGTLTSIESLTKRWIDPKNKKDAKWRDGQFQNIVGGVKGVWTESEAKRYIKKQRNDFGLKNKDIPRSLSGNKFFDLLAGKQYFEVKGKRKENPLKILKKAANLYLSNPKVNHQNNIAERIDLGASKLFEKGINLIMARDTKFSRETINAAGGMIRYRNLDERGNQVGEILSSGRKEHSNVWAQLIEGKLHPRIKDQRAANKDVLITENMLVGDSAASYLAYKQSKAATGQTPLAAAAQEKKNSIIRIDASRLATMLVPQTGYRSKATYQTTAKEGFHPDGGRQMTAGVKKIINWRVEGIKKNAGKASAESIIEKNVASAYNRTALTVANSLTGGKLGAFGPQAKPSKQKIGSVSGFIFEDALNLVGKGQSFAKEGSAFDIIGTPHKNLAELFGYYTPFADAKIADNKGHRASFAKKILNIRGGADKSEGAPRRRDQAIMGYKKRGGVYGPDFASKGAYAQGAKQNKHGTTQLQSWNDSLLGKQSGFGNKSFSEIQKSMGKIAREGHFMSGPRRFGDESKALWGNSEGFIPNMSDGFIPNMDDGFVPNFGKGVMHFRRKNRGSTRKSKGKGTRAYRKTQNMRDQEQRGGGSKSFKVVGGIAQPINRNSGDNWYYSPRLNSATQSPVNLDIKTNRATFAGRAGLSQSSLNSARVSKLESRVSSLEAKVSSNSSKVDPWASAYREDSRYLYNGASGYIPNYAEGWGWVQEILDKEVREQSAVGNKWKNLMVGGDKVQDQDKYRVSVDNKTGKVSYIDNKNSTINDPVGSTRGKRAILNNPDIQKTILNKFNSRLVEIQSYNEGGGKMLRNFGSKIFGKDLVERLTIDPQKQQQKELFNRFIERVRSSGVQNNPGLHIGTGGRSIMNLADNPVVQLKESGLRSILEGKGADGRGIPSGVKNSMVMDDFIRGMMMSSVSQGPNAGATSMKRLSGMSGLLGGLSKLGIGQLGERFFRLADWGKSAFQYPGTKIAELYNWNSMRKEERARVQKEKQRMFAEQKRIKQKAHAELNEQRKMEKLWLKLQGKFIHAETGNQFTQSQLERYNYFKQNEKRNKEVIGMMGRGLHVFKDAAGKPITWAKNAKGKLGDAKNKAGQVIQDLLFSGKKGLGMMGSGAKDFLYYYGTGQADGIDRYERGSQRLLDSGTSKVATSSVQEALEKKERKKSRRGRVLRYLVKKSYKKIRDKFLVPERHSDPLVKGGSIGPMFKVFDSISSLYGKAKGGLRSAGADPLASGKGSMFKLFDFIDKVRGRPDVNRSGSEGIFSRFKNELINLTNEGARRGERVGDSPKGASKAGAPGMGPQIGLVFHNLLESLKNHARPAGESMSNWWKSFSTGSKFGVSKNKSDKDYAPKRSVLKRLVSGISGSIPDLKFPNMNAKSIFGKLRDKGFLTRKEAVDLEKQHQSPRQSSSQQRRSKKVSRKKSRKQTKRLENQTGYQTPQRDPLKFGMYEKISEFMGRRKNELIKGWDWTSGKVGKGWGFLGEMASEAKSSGSQNLSLAGSMASNQMAAIAASLRGSMTKKNLVSAGIGSGLIGGGVLGGKYLASMFGAGAGAGAGTGAGVGTGVSGTGIALGGAGAGTAGAGAGGVGAFLKFALSGTLGNIGAAVMPTLGSAVFPALAGYYLYKKFGLSQEARSKRTKKIHKKYLKNQKKHVRRMKKIAQRKKFNEGMRQWDSKGSNYYGQPERYKYKDKIFKTNSGILVHSAERKFENDRTREFQKAFDIKKAINPKMPDDEIRKQLREIGYSDQKSQIYRRSNRPIDIDGSHKKGVDYMKELRDKYPNLSEAELLEKAKQEHSRGTKRQRRGGPSNVSSDFLKQMRDVLAMADQIKANPLKPISIPRGLRGRAGGFIPNFSKLSMLIEARNAKKRSMGPGELAIRKPAAKTNIANHPGKNPLTEGYVKMYNQGKITEKELFEMVRGQAGMLKGNPQKFQDQMDYVARSVQKAPQYVQKEKINDMRKTAVDAAGGFIPNFSFVRAAQASRLSKNKKFKELGSGMEGTAFLQKGTPWGLKVMHELNAKGRSNKVFQEQAKIRQSEAMRAGDMARMFNKMNKNGPMFAPQMSYGPSSAIGGKNAIKFRFINGKSLVDLVKSKKITEAEQKKLLKHLKEKWIPKHKEMQKKHGYLPKLDANPENFIIPNRKLKGFLKAVRSGNLNNLPKKSVSTIDLLESRRKSPFGHSSVHAGGFIPSFSNPFAASYNREKAALRDRGIPSSEIRLERSPKLADSKLNPGGWAFTNKVDERLGINEGINRSLSMGINPKIHGMSEGFVPNFRASLLSKIIGPGRRPTRKINPAYNKPTTLTQGKPPPKVKKYAESKKAFNKRQKKWEKQNEAFKASQMNMTMGAMFMGPMLAQQIEAGQTAKDKLGFKGALTGTASGAAMGAGFGAMLGPKGMAAGAIIGAAHGAGDAIMHQADNKALSEIGEELSKGKDKLDAKLKNMEAMIEYRKGVQGLNDAFKSGDLSKIKSSQKLMSQSMASITDPSAIKKLNDITNGTMSFTDQIEALGGVLADVEKNAKNAKNALEIATAISTGTEREKSFFKSTGEFFVDYMMPGAPLVSGMRSGKGFFESLNPYDMMGDANGGLSIATSLNDARWDESEAKDLASKLRSNFKTGNLQSVEDITREEFNRQSLKKGFNKSYDDFSKDFQDEAAIISAEETLESMQKDLNLLEDSRLDVLRGSVSNNRFGSDVDQNKLLYGDKDDLKNAKIMGNNLTDLEKQMAKDKLNQASFVKQLRDSGQSAAADQMIAGILDPSENNLSKENLLMMKDQIETQEKLIDSLEKNADSNLKNAGKVQNVEDELKSLLKEVKLLNFAIQDFNKNRETVEQVRSINRDTLERDVSTKTNILSSVGAISEREAIARSGALQEYISKRSSNQEIRKQMMERMLEGADPNSLIDMDKILEEKGLSSEKAEGGYLERERKELEKKERPEREEFTNKFTDFMKGNADGNVTLLEIKEFVKTLNDKNEYSNRIQTDLKNIQLREGVILSAQLNQLKSENRNKNLELDARFINKMGSSIMSSGDATKISDAVYTGGLMRKGERSKFVKGLGRTVSEEENEAINSAAQAFIEESLGVSISGMTGRTGLDGAKAKVNWNIKKLEKQVGPDGEDLISFLNKRKNIVFKNMDEIDTIQKNQFKDIGYGGELTDSLSDNGKMIASTASIASNTQAFYNLASGSGINISRESQTGISAGIVSGLEAAIGASVNKDLGEKDTMENERKVKTQNAKDEKETTKIFAPVDMSKVRGLGSSYKNLIEGGYNLKENSVLGDPRALIQDRESKSEMANIFGSKDPLNAKGLAFESIPEETFNLAFLTSLREVGQENLKNNKFGIEEEQLVKNLAKKLELLKSKPRAGKYGVRPRQDAMAKAKEIVQDQVLRAQGSTSTTGLTSGVFSSSSSGLNQIGLELLPEAIKNKYGPNSSNKFARSALDQFDKNRKGTMDRLRSNVQSTSEGFLQLESNAINDHLQNEKLKDVEGKKAFLDQKAIEFLDARGVDVSGTGQLNLPEWAKDAKGAPLSGEALTQEWKRQAPDRQLERERQEAGRRLELDYLRATGGQEARDEIYNRPTPANNTGGDGNPQGGAGDGGQGDGAAMKQASDSINALPGELKNELESVVLNHGITGNVTLDFNTEMFSQALGPVMLDQLKNMILNPMISELMARALEGELKIRPDQIA